jgi:hypothetical protein
MLVSGVVQGVLHTRHMPQGKEQARHGMPPPNPAGPGLCVCHGLRRQWDACALQQAQPAALRPGGTDPPQFRWGTSPAAATSSYMCSKEAVGDE